MRNTGGNKYETAAREIQNYQIGAFFSKMKYDLQKSDSSGLKSERKKILTSST